MLIDTDNTRDEETEIPEFAPMLPTREQVFFPHMIFPLNVGRPKSIRALEEARNKDRVIILVAQREAGEDEAGRCVCRGVEEMPGAPPA